MYWLLEAPFILKVEMAEAKRWLRHIAASVADVVDEEVSEPIRVLRLPGSFNFKYDPPRPVTTILYEPRRVYSLDQIRGAWGEPEICETESKPFAVQDTIAKGGRHTELYKFLRSQKARNVPLDVALVGCHALNELQCKPPIARKELDDYLRRVWGQADAHEFGKHLDDVPPDEGKLTFASFTDIKRKHPEHLFGKRLYRGSPTLLVGEGAVGKGFILADIAASPRTSASRGDQI